MTHWLCGGTYVVVDRIGRVINYRCSKCSKPKMKIVGRSS